MNERPETPQAALPEYAAPSNTNGKYVAVSSSLHPACPVSRPLGTGRRFILDSSTPSSSAAPTRTCRLCLSGNVTGDGSIWPPCRQSPCCETHGQFCAGHSSSAFLIAVLTLALPEAVRTSSEPYLVVLNSLPKSALAPLTDRLARRQLPHNHHRCRNVCGNLRVRF